jgi:hypothetical protein
VRRGLQTQCFITYAPRGSRTRARAERAAATQRMSISSNQSVQPMEEESYRPLTPSHSQQDEEKDGQDTTSATNPRMLLNSRGERGETTWSKNMPLKDTDQFEQSTLAALHRYRFFKLFAISSLNKSDPRHSLTMRRAIRCLRLSRQLPQRMTDFTSWF